jgi:HlyD family secretion protein
VLDMPRKVDKLPDVSADTNPSTRGRHHLLRPQTWLQLLRPVAGRIWSWRTRGPALVASVAALCFYGVPLVLGPVVIGTPVVRADFVQSVVASGNVLAPYRVNIGSQITGVVAGVPVAEGQIVKAGDTLIELDGREARALVVQAEGAVAQAQARMRQMQELTLPSAEETLKQAQATLINAQATFDRAKRLADQGFGTKAILDDATRARDVAKAQLRAAEFQVFTSRPGGSDYVMAETQLNQARANLESARSRLTYTVITAPRDGVLISRNVERGNIVQPSNVLMVLSPAGETQLQVQIDEKNLGLIALGLKAIASTDAYPKEKFEAHVVYINPGIDLQRASVEVKLLVPDPPAYLRQDMTVSVDIETAFHAGALIVPATSLRGVSIGKPWVLQVKSGRTVHQPVRLGLVSAGKAEVLEGLTAGDVVLPATAPTKEGARVRAQTTAGRPS